MTKSRPNSDEPCPIRDILNRIGDRWSLLALWSLTERSRRFSELRRDIGDISQRMLAQTLRRRAAMAGRVLRAPRADYALSPLGGSFLAPLNVLIDWADAYHQEIRKARRSHASVRPRQ